MSRSPIPRTSIVALVAALLGMALPCGPSCAADDHADRALEVWLADLGLDTLGADFLEIRLARAEADEKPDLAKRLARRYARLLDEAEEPADIDRYTARSRALFALIPKDEASQLRLALARTSFRQTERAAERARLAFPDAPDPVLSARRFGDLLTEFDDLAADATRRLVVLETQERTGRVPNERLLGLALSEARRQRSLASYLAGWSATYIAEIESSAESADLALIRLGRLLNVPEGARPDLEKLPDQTLEYPHVARAALATAICYAVKGSMGVATGWLNRIESAPKLPDGVADQAFATRLMVLARGGRFGELLAVASRRRERFESEPAPLSPPHARLLAVLALTAITEGRSGSPAVAHARDLALADLARTGDLGHIIELARHFGAHAFDSDSFTSLYVRALIAYDNVRAQHVASGGDPEQPTDDPDLAREYLHTAELLEHAIRRPDALRNTDTLAAAASLIGLCNFYAAAHDAGTVDWFVQAAEHAPDERRAANALWMAIHTLDRSLEGDEAPDAESLARRDQLIDTFLGRHPEHERAAALVIRRATGTGVEPAHAIDLLLSVDPDNALHETARRHAARLLYTLARRGAVTDAEFRRLQYLSVATPLLTVDTRLASAGEAEAAERTATRARRIADIALARETPDTRLAQRALDTLEWLVNAGLIERETIEAESLFRSGQIALARDDPDGARALFARAASADPDLADAGARTIYRAALRRFRGEPTEASARSLYESGVALLAVLDARLLPPDSPVVLSVLSNTAVAATRLALEHDDRAAARRAIDLYERLTGASTPSADALRNLARVAQSVGQNDRALAAWRRLGAALPPGADRWYEARVAIITILSTTDPDRARRILSQHLVLHPEPAPEPFRSQIEALAQRLRVAAPSRRGEAT